MAHRYEPVAASDDNEIFSLKDIPSNLATSYFSGTPTSAPPSFRSRTSSLNDHDLGPGQLRSFLASQSATNNNQTPSINTDNSASSTAARQNEIIASLLARIERLEGDKNVKRNEDEDGSEDEHGDAESMLMGRPRRRKNKGNCCNTTVVAIVCAFVTFVVIMLAWVLVEFIEAWGKRGNVKCD